jgi:hypothetical protein
MSNVFQDALSDVNELQETLLGPNYNYPDQIKSPSEMGMSSNGSWGALTKDISGLIGYVQVLVTGQSKASKTGKPLGTKFFLKTGAKCKDKKSGELVQRYVYLDNVPDGTIPFISSGLGVNFTTFRGLIPGIMSNIGKVNPFQILQSFVMGSNPECQEITLQTIDSKNNVSTETQFVATLDIESMNACSFPDKKNPLTGVKCKEAFSNMNVSEFKSSKMPEELIAKVYFSALGVFGFYILLKLLQSKRK